MEKPNETGAEPKTPSFDDAVGKEQPFNTIPSDTSTEEKPDKKPDANGDKPEDQSGVKPNDKSESPEDKDKKPEGDKTFWGKFKSEDDAKRSYDEAQTKIIDQGKEINDLKTASEKNQQFLSVLDKALVKNPQLAEQLKASIAEAMKASDAEPEDQPDIDTLLDKKLEERETKAKTKAEIDKWIEDHEDFRTPEIGHQILDLIEKEKLPFNERTHPESAVAHQLPKARPIKRIHSMILSVKVLTPTKSGNAYKILRSRERLPAVTTTTYGRTCTHHRHEGYADYRTVTAYSRCRRQNLPA